MPARNAQDFRQHIRENVYRDVFIKWGSRRYDAVVMLCIHETEHSAMYDELSNTPGHQLHTVFTYAIERCLYEDHK